MEIPRVYVPKHFIMNPLSDDLVPNGRHLVNGLIVLPESDNVRAHVNEIGDDVQSARWHKYNRWCAVDKLKIEGDGISFIGIYYDGTKRFFTGSVNTAWYIKIDSYPDAHSFMTVQQLQELDAAVDQLTEEFITKLRENNEKPKVEQKETMTTQLMKIFDETKVQKLYEEQAVEETGEKGGE